MTLATSFNYADWIQGGVPMHLTRLGLQESLRQPEIQAILKGRKFVHEYRVFRSMMPRARKPWTTCGPRSRGRSTASKASTSSGALEAVQTRHLPAKNRQVNPAYAVPDDTLFVSVTGRGSIVEDAKKKELWYDELKRWFPEGPEDDAVVLIRVTGEYAYYWSKEGDAELNL